MNDNVDNVTFLKPKAKPINPDEESLSYFLEGVDEYNSYQDSERAGKAVMSGIIKVCQEKFGIKDEESFFSDSAVIAVLVYGMFLRQRGIETPETHLLDNIREGLNSVISKDEEK